MNQKCKHMFGLFKASKNFEIQEGIKCKIHRKFDYKTSTSEYSK
jgi:hypothetical protein